MDVEKAKARLRHVADELGLPFGERKRTYNTRLAQELAKWAESKGKGDSFHEAVFRAYFVDGKNIGNTDELAALANSIGLPEQEARSVLESRTFREAVDSDWSRSYAFGVTAVPTFVIDRHSVVGAQPYEALEGLLKTCGIKRRLSA
jgi:predicted DsbA family dithiol-disulfide isomerase